MRILITYIIFLLPLFLNPMIVTAQIDFSGFSSQYSPNGSYSTSIIDLGDGTLDFDKLLNDQGVVNIGILDNETLEFELSGVKYLDLFVTVNADANMELLGCASESCRIPFTLGASFTNRGVNSKAQATEIFIDMSNNGDVVFPIRYRGNLPPGPPPTPFYEGFIPETEKAYLYIYGSIDVGIKDSGIYSGDITITVNYD